MGRLGVAPLPAGAIASIAAAHGDEARVVVTLEGGGVLRIDVPQPDPLELVVREGPEHDGPWEVISRMPCSDHDHFLAEAGGILWVAGGLTNHRGYPAERHVFAELQHYSPRDGAWGSVPMPIALAYCAIAALDERIFVVGGHTHPDDVPQSSVSSDPSVNASA